jgi:hypothetical protein
MLDISTPTLVFPALSVLLLAYTNKFISIVSRYRTLRSQHLSQPSKELYEEMNFLKRRMKLIRNMQIFALGGFAINIISMMVIYYQPIAIYAVFPFIIGLIFVLISLIICIYEIYTSSHIMDENLTCCENVE